MSTELPDDQPQSINEPVVESLQSGFPKGGRSFDNTRAADGPEPNGSTIPEKALFVQRLQLAVAIAVFLAAGFAGFMAYSQLGIARQSFEATQRAYVSVKGLEIVDQGTYWKVTPILVNNGNTPTKNAWFTMTGGDFDMSYNPNTPRPYMTENLWQATQNRVSLGPKQEKTIQAFGQLIEHRYTDAIRAQTMRPYFHGAIVYEDFFSAKLHLTRYCYFLWGFPPITGPVGFSSSECGKASNCSDEECDDYGKLVMTPFPRPQ